MKTLETARAEAESIATRWVPAHMTARSGLVDDIAAALLGAALVGFGDGQDEGRSLVEEAQADAKHWQEQVEMLSAVGTGVLTEQSTELEAAQADAKSWMERSIAIQKQEEQAEHELDRLKGELAEARRLISEAFPNVRDDGLSAKLRAFVTIWPSAAATPAEQAQGEGAKHSSDCAQLRLAAVGTAAEEAQAERDRLVGELVEARHDLGYYRRNFPGHCIPRPVAATPDEQAQGEAAKRYVACAGTCGRRVMVYPGEDPVWHCGNAHCQIRTAAPDGHHRSSREASMSPQTENYAEEVRMPVDSDAQRHNNGLLARVNALLDALTARLDRITSPPPPRPFVSEVKRHWDDPAVRDNFVDATLDDHGSRLRDLEWRFKAAHAVPPIAGGAKP
jgi:hypothetical protein